MVTEFNPRVVERMRSILKLEAATFHFNSHLLEDMVERKFDVISVRYAINFCREVPRFIGSLKKRLAAGGIVYVSLVLPSLGTCIRWQLDDYTYLVLYHSETMWRFFAQAGFTLLSKYHEEDYHYLTRLPQPVRGFAWATYRANQRKLVNSDPLQKSIVMIFKMDSDQD
jgi:hypothetical protein